MSFLWLIVLGVCSASSLIAQSTRIPLSFQNRIPSGVQTKVQTLGIHDSATIGYDESLGEIEIPPFPLPGGIFYVWTVVETPEVIWLSPLDLRPQRPGTRWLDTFDIRVAWSGGTLDVSWPSTKPETIDSAYLIDAFSDFPRNVVKAKLWSNDVFSTANPAIDRFRLLVWWNTTNTSVNADRRTSTNVEIFPLPSSSSLTIRANAASYMLSDLVGRVLLQGALQDGETTLNVDHLVPGTYLVRLISPSSIVGRTIVIE